MAIIEPMLHTSPSPSSSATTSNNPLPKPPSRSADFTYPQPADQPRSLEETLKSWDSVPLFIKHLPTSSDGANTSHDPTHTALDALQSLAFDGTPDDVAANFKSQANHYFSAKRFREALGFYTQAIHAHPTDPTLLQSLYANRAATNLQLQNYAATLRDTSNVLQLNPNNQKAYYRASKALLALDRANDARDCAEHGLKLNSANQAIRALKEKAETRLAQLERAQHEKTQRNRRQGLLATALQHALILRGLWLETTPCPPHNPQPAHFDQSSLPLVRSAGEKWQPPDLIRTPLVLPVFFIYPQHAQSDFVADFHEDTPIGEYISTIFPASSRGSLPWDQAGEYVDANLQLYATTRKMRLLKVGKKLTLRQLMHQAFKEADQAKRQHPLNDRDGLVMRDGILSLILVPKGKAEQEWVEKFKAEREKQQQKK